LGLRNLLGILFPGGLLILAILGCFAVLSPDAGTAVGKAMTGQPSLVISAAFLLSYVAGSVLRLHSADLVDTLSAMLIRRDNKLPTKGGPGVAQGTGPLQTEFDLLANLTSSEEVAKGLAHLFQLTADPKIEWERRNYSSKWAWKHDKFPYPVWEWIKFRLYHPPEMVAFYDEYRDCFMKGARRGKEFFNYCKLVIFSANDGKPHALAEEVQAAEANGRFFAGTFFALTISFFALTATAITSELTHSASRSVNSIVAILALVVGLAAFFIIADGRFRLLRLKEVDIVFDAFFLVHRHPGRCILCSRGEKTDLFKARRSLVENAFSGGMTLQSLLGTMRERSRQDSRLSSLYFCGADRDHPYFLHTDSLAAGFSVLPEDVWKSSVAKRHPHQSEVILVLEGELDLELLEEGGWHTTRLKSGEVKVILPGICHRIFSGNEDPAAFLFVKTHPARKPREEDCNDRKKLS